MKSVYLDYTVFEGDKMTKEERTLRLRLQREISVEDCLWELAEEGGASKRYSRPRTLERQA